MSVYVTLVFPKQRLSFLVHCHLAGCLQTVNVGNELCITLPIQLSSARVKCCTGVSIWHLQKVKEERLFMINLQHHSVYTGVVTWHGNPHPLGVVNYGLKVAQVCRGSSTMLRDTQEGTWCPYLHYSSTRNSEKLAPGSPWGVPKPYILFLLC